MASTHVVIDDAAIQRLLKSPDGPVAKAIVAATIRVERRAKKNLSRRGGGRVYQKYTPRRRHRASAPGQPPATDTGRLRASVTRELRVDSRGIVGIVGTDVTYGRYLELGTSTMRPRPWLRPALQAATVEGAGRLTAFDQLEREARSAARERARVIRERRRTLLGKAGD